ncbi:MAG: hypothetical protein RR494_06025 [Vagococcus sp.]|uniref:hypothetical protein n=1 Tax=Vagococcus sp. TaxID=1933889 RepID=UPI002FC640FD
MKQTKFLSIDIVRLFVEASTDEDREELIKNYKLYYSKTNVADAPYPEITDYVLTKEEDINIDSIIDNYTNDRADRFNDLEGWDKFSKSFEKHYKLAEIQKKHIANMFSEMKQDVKDAEDKVNEIKDIKSTIYTEFIAILGIFSALLFGMFVGFDTFKELIAGITSNVKISRVIILGSLMLLGLNFLVFLLFEGIAKLSNRSVKSCCNEAKCNCSLLEKHPIFLSSTIILSMIMLIASSVMILNADGMLYSNTYKGLFLIIIVLLLLILLVVMITEILYIRKK